MTTTLIADRFVVRAAGPALDLATGARVRLRIEPAGTRAAQQAWTDACTRAHAEGTLVDFGFIGCGDRFEARPQRGESSSSRPAKETTEIVEWLDEARPSSSRVLQVAEFPDIRAVRQRGFVPCDTALLEDPACRADACAVLSGRSVALLDSRGSPVRAALAVLSLAGCRVRDFRLVALRRESPRAHVVAAAEGRATYGGTPRLLDARAGRLIAEVERLTLRGRHAAAERTLREAIAAFDRRSDARRAGAAELTLGRLLLGRGRAAEAKSMFAKAHERFQRERAVGESLEALVFLGLAQTDLAHLTDAEQTCRVAYSAASALGSEAVLFPALALVRSLIWQGRHADARSILDAVAPVGDTEQCARYWCLAARLRIAADAVADAWRSVERARPPSSGLTSVIESVVCECEAAVQGRLGDAEALRIHVANGLAAARRARLPLQAIKLRLTYIEGLHRAERFAQARTAARHLADIRGRGVPPLLKSRIESVLGALNKPPAVRETTLSFQPSCATGVDDLDGLRELLASAHHDGDETTVLAHAAQAIRRHTHALGVVIFGRSDTSPGTLASSGTASSTVARRAIDVGQPIRPERSPTGVEAAVPIQYLGRTLGAVAMRWSIEGPENAERALAFCGAAAAVCAPFVYVLAERQDVPATTEAAFDLVGTSSAIEQVRKAIARAANAPFTVLIEGESGSGKELVARAIHRAGSRRERRYSAFNCAAMPEDLVDAELFGHAKGAFTGAATERLGLFESAEGGTVFLDEVGELSARAQAKVLRVLQEGEIRRIGENFTRPFDARLVAATNCPLRGLVDAGRFRQDLLYRLDVIRINVPPLRERVEDIPALAARFWRQSADRIGSKAVLAQSAVCALARYDWPGNVRELQNVLAALVVAVPQRGVVSASEMPAAIARAAHVSSHESLEHARIKFEERFVRAALARAAGHRGQTAAALGLSRQGLAKLMQRLHLDA